MQTWLLSEGTAGHSCVWRWGYSLQMDGPRLMFEEERVFIDLTTSQRIIFCKNLDRDFFPSPPSPPLFQKS